ncbi:MAG: hypothetical protein HN737_02285 [Desulfobacterales bacterium]|nr:hypothetical protein [Desulfobacteraceae bacterium]MBT4364422.1 hypothetical protein [Desulfobacteraceae bacterium]MBT7085683.1 hypothetical protein [Desulfobacterales bacterium]MBT7696218.1 hypothetical protein [Desulfobacterales bacterium]
MNTNKKKIYSVLLISFLVILEFVLRYLAAADIFPYQHHPASFHPVYWDDVDPVVGAWRYNNAVLRHNEPCFDVTYSTNSYGARDIERERHSSAVKRVVVLGDSFIEGFGIETEKRMTDVLEKKTGIEHLNFGAGGGFGSIQEWLLYENLASKYDHSDIFIFMLPRSDFSDNNPANFPKERYRPYLNKIDGEYKVYYTVDFDKRRNAFRGKSETIKNIIDNNVYIANFLRWSVREFKIRYGNKYKNISDNNSSIYDSFNKNDLELLLYTYRQILNIAGTRQVYLFTIPVEQDFNAAKRNGYNFKLVKELKSFSAMYTNLHYVDLLDDFLKHSEENGLEFRDYTLDCNPHWGERGNKFIADVVEDKVYKR